MTAGNLMLTRDHCSDSAEGPECVSWRLVGRYATVGAAEEAVARLKGKGIHATLSMIDGVAVLAAK